MPLQNSVSDPGFQPMTAAGGLASRFKAVEQAHRHVLAAGGFVIVRVDGKSFHTYVKGLDRPFDRDFATAMVGAGLALCESDCPARLAYVQSDEISVVMDVRTGQPWFGGRIDKITSVVSSMVTAHFNQAMSTRTGRLGYFDARVLALDLVADVIGYLEWRRADALRNSVSMLAHHTFSDASLRGVGTAERKKMLASAGNSWDDLPVDLKAGALLIPEKRRETVTFTRKDGGPQQSVEVDRTHWVTRSAIDVDVQQLMTLVLGEPGRS